MYDEQPVEGTVEIVQEIDRGKWFDFVRTHKHGNIFQTPQMYDVYVRTKNYDPRLIGIEDGTGDVLGVLVAVIQRDYVNFASGLTARSIIWGGPLARNDDAEVKRALLQGYDDLVGSSVIYTQIRNLWDTEEDRKIYESQRYIHEMHLNIIVDISKSEDVLWQEVHSKRRNEIRRAQKEGTYVQELTALSDVAEAYEILSEVYRHARLPIADRSMFEAAFEILRPMDMCRYFGAYNGGKLLGVICLLAFNGCLYDWYAGSLRQYLSKYPNDLLPWEVFKWGREHGFVRFDFGGAGKPYKEYGVRDYKKKFGGVVVDLGRFQKIHKPVKYLLAKKGYGVWRFLRGRGLLGMGRP